MEWVDLDKSSKMVSTLIEMKEEKTYAATL